MSEGSGEFKVFGLDMRNPVSILNMANQARFGSAFTDAMRQSQAKAPKQENLGQQLQKSMPKQEEPKKKTDR